MDAKKILAQLLGARPVALDELPRVRGIYHLYDHLGQPRYIGKAKTSLRYRVWSNHAAGDNNSHKFSTVYNAGRMFHTRADLHTDNMDGKIAKKLRRLFARARCHAAVVELPHLDIPTLAAREQELLALAPPEVKLWNGSKALEAYEPIEAVDDFLKETVWSQSQIEALERQARRWRRKLGL